MADNVDLNVMTGGSTVATDNVQVTGQAAAGHVQFIKLVDGTANGVAPIASGGGVEAGALRVTIASDSTGVVAVTNAGITTIAGAVTGTEMQCDVITMPTVTVNAHAVTNAGTFVVQENGAALTALQLIDNAISGAGFNITQVNGETIDVGAGTEAAAIRVTLPTDGTGVVKLGAGTAEIGKLAAGTAEIGKLGAGTAEIGKLAAGTANIGDVDIISGTVTTVSTVTNLSQLGGQAISMGTGTRDAGTQRVTIATNDAVPVTFTGSTDVATQTTLAAINTKLATGTVIGDVNLGATDNAVLDSIVTNTNRAAITGYGQAKLDNADVTTAQVLVAAVASNKFYITSIIFSAAAAGSYWIEDDDAAQITCKWTLAANGGVSWSCPIDTPFKSTTVNKGLKVKGSAAGVIGCMITYYTLA